MNATPDFLARLYAKPYYSATRMPLSPQPPHDGWRGVLIHVPQEVTLTLKQPTVLLHGTYRIQGDKYPKQDLLRLVAVELASKKEYSGVAGQRDDSPDAPPPPAPAPAPAVIQRMVFSGFFNADLVATLKLPWSSASYRVRAELGDIRSNDVTVKVAVP
jgi:hypothetical protein